MLIEAFLYPTQDQTQKLLQLMYDLPSARNLRNLLADRIKSDHEKLPILLKFVKDTLEKFRLQHSIQLELNDGEIEGLVGYLLAHGDLDFTFLNKVYQVYNEALKRSIVQTSKFPRVSAVLYDLQAFLISAAGQFRDSYS